MTEENIELQVATKTDETQLDDTELDDSGGESPRHKETLDDNPPNESTQKLVSDKKLSKHEMAIKTLEDEKAFRLHVFLDKKPLLGFCVFCGMFLLTFLIIIIITATSKLVNFTTEFPMYMRDHVAKKNYDALIAGEDEATFERTTSQFLRQATSSDVSLQVIFTSKKKTLLVSDVLEKIQQIEEKIFATSGYENYCERVYTDASGETWSCKRQNSITHFFDVDYFIGALDQTYDFTPTENNYLNFVQPSKIFNTTVSITPVYTDSNIKNISEYWAEYGEGSLSTKYGQGLYNGKLLPAEFHYSQPVDNVFENSTLVNLFESIVDAEFGATPTATDVKAALTVFNFGLPLEGYASPTEDTTDQEDDISEWVFDNLHDELWKDKSQKKFRLSWDCGTMVDFYINDLLVGDMALLLGTIITIWIYMVAAVGSFWLGNMGMLMIFMNFAPTLLLYRYITQFEYFGTLNMLCLFIILSIGADDMFVLVDTWTQVRTEGPDVNRAKRLTHALKHAGKVMATTSLSTIVSFIGNTTSVFPAIYCFGAFAAWLVFVNYCAVVLFYPSVLILHDEYFYTPDLKYGFCVSKWCYNNKKVCVCCWSEGSKCYNVKTLEDKEQEHKQRSIDKFFETTFYRCIRRFHKLILVIFAVIFVVFFFFAAQLEPDPKPPQILPDSDPYQKFGDDISDNFASQSSFQLTNHFVFGIKGINRKNTDETLPDDIGKVRLSGNMSFSLYNEQLWLAQFCDDLLCETGDYDCRYRERTSKLKISDPNGVDLDVRKCFMTEFRTWALNDPDAAPNKTQILKVYENQNLSLCYNESDFLQCNWREFPQNSSSCFEFLFLYIWLEDDLPTTNPDYTVGTINFDYWKSYLYGSTIEDSEEAFVNNSCFPAVLDFFQFSVTMDAYTRTNFETGIKLWEDWDDYIDAWKSNTPGDVSQDQYGNDFVDMPRRYKDLFFTDHSDGFAYFYLQEQIITESITGIGISLILALFILIGATGNWIIALMSTTVIFMIVCCVIGFAIMLGWKLGAIESIIFIMVVGMSVDYVVHLSEAYLSVNAQSRTRRARKMVGRIGGSILSGFLSTLLGIIWLTGAYILFFYKFGLEIAFLEVCSVSFGLIAFTAAVSSFGPQGEMGDVKKDSLILKECCYNVCCGDGTSLYNEEEESISGTKSKDKEFDD